MNLDADAMLKESAERMGDVSGALSSRCVLLAGQLGAANKLLARMQDELTRALAEIQSLKNRPAEKDVEFR